MAGLPRRERGTRRRLLASVVLVSTLVGVVVLATGSLPPSALAPDGRQSTPGGAASPYGELEALHAEGVTGENVTVGVVDVTGFDTGDPAIADRVVDARSFTPGEGVANGGANDHGTATARVVARSAPDAGLYLASFDTADEFRVAVAWLVARDVDVIVAPVAFYGAPGDGSSAVARAATRATRNGVVFVTSVGNVGRSHWRGRFSPDGDGTHRFDGGPRNYLLGEDDTVRLWLSWQGRDGEAPLALELYRTNGSASHLVARSQPFRADDAPNARLVVRVDPDSTYYFVVRGSGVADGRGFAVTSPSHEFQYRRRAGSVVAPATAEDVVAVGAYDERRDRVAAFSGAGPVGDGRPGVDVVADGHHPSVGGTASFVGSSAAAAYVGGVAALLLDANPALGPLAVEGVLEATAGDVGPRGTDAVSGAGRIAPREAVAAARNATQG